MQRQAYPPGFVIHVPDPQGFCAHRLADVVMLRVVIFGVVGEVNAVVTLLLPRGTLLTVTVPLIVVIFDVAAAADEKFVLLVGLLVVVEVVVVSWSTDICVEVNDDALPFVVTFDFVAILVVLGLVLAAVAI